MKGYRTYLVAIAVEAATEDDLPSPQGILNGIRDGLPEPWFTEGDGDDFFIARMVSDADWTISVKGERLRTQRLGWQHLPFDQMEREAYCPRCNCNRSGSATEHNYKTEACDDDNCPCHDEDLEVQ